MTAVLDPPVVAAPVVPAGPAAPVAPQPWRPVVYGALLVLSALLLGLVADIAVLGHLRHERDQGIARDALRLQLAEATVPVGEVDYDDHAVGLGAPLLMLDIDRIDLHEVVLEGTTSLVLTSGPGHRRDTVLPGQVGTSILMARRAGFGGPFAHLDRLKVGDVIKATTGQGEQTFRVTGLRRDGDPLPTPRAAGTGGLVLMTADGAPFQPDGVLRVDAALTSDPQPAGARLTRLATLPRAERAMQPDHGADVPLLLWSQALLLAAAATTWLRRAWGRRQAWVVAVPLLAVTGLGVADQLARLLPNLL
ncbi:MAG: hypothetical protein JWL64_61 [Frankiales bacterium]|nr:hypothetical protein [Frankiales bacterium]